MGLGFRAIPKQLYIITSLLLLIGVGYPKLAQADTAPKFGTPGTVTLSPTTKELTLGPGLLEASTTITLSNQTESGLVAQLKAVDLSSLDQTGELSFGRAGQPASKYPLAGWMNLPGGNKIDLPKGKTADVLLHIANRSDLAPGGHYGAVVVSLSPANKPAGNRVMFNQQLVSFVFVKKLGGEQYGLQLKALTPDSNKPLPNFVSMGFKSTGNVHVVPRGYVTVTDPSGKVVAKGIINPESTLILPGVERNFKTLLQPVAAAKLTGRYKITAYYRHDDQPGFKQLSVYFDHRDRPILAIAAALVINAVFISFVVWWWLIKK